MHGYWRKVLRIDLTKGSAETEDIDQSLIEQYLGGAGLAAKYILDGVGPGADPLSPENALVFSVGPFQGTRIPGSGRWIISSKSPLTGILADSCAGGNWGPEFKRSGFDALVISGKAESPVYLWINDGRAEIRDATRIWGKPISETDAAVKEDLQASGARVACIGPAGENLVRFACVANRSGYAGRCGLGAVMGSKNLKAVAVQGTKEVEIAHPQETNDYSKALFKKYYDATLNTMRKYGTTASMKKYYDRGYGLVKNWREWEFENAGQIDGAHFLDMTVKPVACAYCPLACHRRTRVEDPEKYAYEGYGPEYESISMLGWLNKISDAKSIGYLGHLCNEYGMDTMTTGSIIGFATECYEKGWISAKDLDGIEPRWGDADAAIALTHKIAQKEGFGSIFAEGVVQAAEHVGQNSSEIVLHCKKLDYPAHDPRSFYPAALNYATGTRGACHQRGFVTWHASGVLIPEWGIDRVFETGSGTLHSMENAPEITVKYQNWAALFNSLVQCEYMIFGGLRLSQQIDLLRHVTGWDVDAACLEEAAERIFTLQRAINVSYGISRKDDTVPQRMFQPLQAGISAGKTPQLFDKALQEYYRLRKWDSDGKPACDIAEPPGGGPTRKSGGRREDI